MNANQDTRSIIAAAAGRGAETDDVTLATAALDRHMVEIGELRTDAETKNDAEDLAWATFAGYASVLAAGPVEWPQAIESLQDLPELDSIREELRTIAARTSNRGLPAAFDAVRCPSAVAAAFAWCGYVGRWDSILDDLRALLVDEVRRRRSVQLGIETPLSDLLSEVEFEYDESLERELAQFAARRDAYARLPSEAISVEYETRSIQRSIQQLIVSSFKQAGIEDGAQRVLADIEGFAARLPSGPAVTDSAKRAAGFALVAKCLASARGVGCPLVEATVSLFATPGTEAVRSDLAKLAWSLETGEELSVALRQAGFPEVICAGASWGDVSGQMGEALSAAAGLHLDEIQLR
jgi:hypothetical protein